MQSRKLALGLAVLAAFLVVDSALAYYSPRLGRFLNRDPISEPGAVLVRHATAPTAYVARDAVPIRGEPAYRYVKNRPMGLIDPLGLQSMEIGAAQAAAAGWSAAEIAATFGMSLDAAKALIAVVVLAPDPRWCKCNCKDKVRVVLNSWGLLMKPDPHWRTTAWLSVLGAGEHHLAVGGAAHLAVLNAALNERGLPPLTAVPDHYRKALAACDGLRNAWHSLRRCLSQPKCAAVAAPVQDAVWSVIGSASQRCSRLRFRTPGP